MLSLENPSWQGKASVEDLARLDRFVPLSLAYNPLPFKVVYIRFIRKKTSVDKPLLEYMNVWWFIRAP